MTIAAHALRVRLRLGRAPAASLRVLLDFAGTHRHYGALDFPLFPVWIRARGQRAGGCRIEGNGRGGHGLLRER